MLTTLRDSVRISWNDRRELQATLEVLINFYSLSRFDAQRPGQPAKVTV